MGYVFERICPGRIWLDTDGNRIQAHGGSVLFADGFYYWYGENKEKTDLGEKLWHWGVRCYRSRDLYNWESLGMIIPPKPDEPGSPLHPATKTDRPHILYNEKTGKYVCWLKIMEQERQTITVLTAPALTGPYEIVRTYWQPLGMSCGDFDLAADENGRAYCYFEHPHSELICAELSEDYTDVNGFFSRHFTGTFPPFTREAPAHFTRGGKHYLFTSGTTGKFPNPSQLAVAEDWHGPFTVLGDPHPGDDSGTSFHSQISCVIKVQGKRDLYIACADRWRPDQMQLPYNWYADQFAAAFDPAIPEPERCVAMEKLYSLPPAYTREANYVWLPLRFEGDMAYLDWQDEWKIEDYD